MTLKASREELKGKPLSPRELTVLQHKAQSKTNAHIAAALGISRDTVKTHLSHVYAKLDVKNATAAVATALRQGIIT